MDHLSDPEHAEHGPEFAARYYREIVVPTREPILVPRGITPIDGLVTDLTTLQIGQTSLHLRGHPLFIWNVLMELRHKSEGVARSDAYTRGFSLSSPSGDARKVSWQQAMKTLTAQVNTAANEEIILREGGGKAVRYFIHPGFRLIEAREGEYDEDRYVLAQLLSAGIVRLPTPRLVGTGLNAIPIEVTLGEKEVITANERAMFYNPHELNLLNLLILNDGEPLSYAQLKTLGFHAHAPSEMARRHALTRTASSLNDLLGGQPDDPVVAHHIDKRARRNEVSLAKPLLIADDRQDSRAPTIDEVGTLFVALLNGPLAGPESAKYISLPQETIVELLSGPGAARLSGLQRYILGLRYGIPQPDLHGTVVRRRDGSLLFYDDIAGNISPDAIIAFGAIARLIGSNATNVYDTTQRALHSLTAEATPPERRKTRAEKIVGNPPVIETANQVAAIDPEQRLSNFLSGTTIWQLGRQLQLTDDAIEALIFHLSPGHINLRHRSGLEEALQSVQSLSRQAVGPNPTALPGQPNNPITAQGYLAKLLGDRGINFDRAALFDPDFAQHGLQMVADALAFLTAYVAAMPKQDH